MNFIDNGGEAPGESYPPAVNVLLSTTEMMVANYVGGASCVQAMHRGWDGGGSTDRFQRNIEGRAGEMAVAKYLNVYWDPILGNPQADDVGPYQVRTNSTRRVENMLYYKHDNPERLFISVLSFYPKFVILGFIKGADAKREEWFREATPGRDKVYIVPRSALTDIRLLPPPMFLPADANKRIAG